MVHTIEFNRKRREQYRLGRLSGLKPRAAGHLYNDNDFNTKVAAYLDQQVDRVGFEASPIERDRTRHANETLRNGKYYYTGRDGRQHADQYAAHNYYGGYAHVRVDVRDPETGIKAHKFFTIVFDSADPPKRGAIIDRVRSLLDANESRYPLELLSVNIASFKGVPDRTRSSPPQTAPPITLPSDAITVVEDAVGSAEDVLFGEPAEPNEEDLE